MSGSSLPDIHSSVDRRGTRAADLYRGGIWGVKENLPFSPHFGETVRIKELIDMDDIGHEADKGTDRSGEGKQEKRKGPSYWISVILALLLVGSFVFNVILVLLFGTYAGMSGSLGEKDNQNFAEQQIMGDEKSKNKILEIPIVGVLMDQEDAGHARDNIVTRVHSELQAARKDESVKGVLLVVNSPGGGITASDILWNEIKTFKKDRKLPIVAFCKDITASGGYYVASYSDYIYAYETSLVGNIGVIAEFVNVSDLFRKIGVQMTIIKSSTSDGKESNKDIGSPFRAMRPGERKIFQNIINEMWGRFVDVVAEGRKGKLTRDEVAKLADGTIYTGKGALEKKLIDAVGQKEEAFKKAKELAKVQDARLVRYKWKYNPLQELLGSQFGARKSIEVMPELNEYLKKRSPRLMYLWTME
jgi:protease-4